ncbi:MAG TPA: NrsF family protein [Polyangiaceae bacterium]|nr:NrsF family protein [Polyangiaceae bacterium]
MTPPPGPPGLPPDLRARVLGSVRERPAPTRPAGVRWRAIVLSLSFSLGALTVCVQGIDVERRPRGAVVAGSLWGALVLALVAWRLLARRGRALWPARGALVATVAGVPAALAVFPPLAAALWPQAGGAGGGLVQGARCLVASAVLGGAALAGLLVAYRKSDPVNPGLSGAALGALAGAWVALSQQLQCPFGDPQHALVTHVLPSLLLSGFGWLLGRYALDPLARGA